MRFNITAFRGSTEFSLELREFEPEEGYESFLREICHYLGETYLSWHQCAESGIGNITYKGYEVGVFWTEFSLALSFDCRDRQMAEQLCVHLQAYFNDKLNAYPFQRVVPMALQSAFTAPSRN